jgi:hypothetical protein
MGSSSCPPKFQLPSWLELTCFGLCVAQGVYVIASFVQGSWVLDPNGQPIATDFVNIWSGGHQILAGEHPAAVYDVPLHKDAETAALGHGFDGEYPWLYPPAFFAAAALLALLPLVPAYGVWVAFTFTAYVAAVRGIIGHRAGILLAVHIRGSCQTLSSGRMVS